MSLINEGVRFHEEEWIARENLNKQSFPLLSEETYFHTPERDDWFNQYETLEYSTPFTTIPIEGDYLNFSIELTNPEYPLMYVLNPYAPELGYSIDDRDFDESARLNKYLENYNQMKTRVGRKEGFVGIRFQTPRLFSMGEKETVMNQFSLIIDTRKGKYLGKAMYNHLGQPDWRYFLPLDCPPPTPISMHPEKALAIFGKSPDDTLTREEVNVAMAVKDAPEAFFLLLPNDRELLEEMRVQVILPKQ